MSLFYQKFERKGNPKNGRYNYYRKGYHYKKNLFNNNFTSYYRSKKLNYDAYEEEISYDRETSYSNNVPSTKNDSFSQSSKSNSRKQSCSKNSIKISQTKKDDIPNINLSENEIKSAFFKPKNLNEKIIKRKEMNDNNQKKENENIIILEIIVNINGKNVLFKLRKFDDMFEVCKKACKDNKINEVYTNFFVYNIIKALNSIYGIYNLCLKDEEIKFLQNLKENYY